MKEPTKDIKYFLFSQHLSDGIRITLEIILPAVIAARFGRLDIGLLLSTGAFCVSMSDAPGLLEHKRNGMLYCNGFVFLMSLLTGFVNQHLVLLTPLIVLSSFFFTMLAVYGIRAASIGIAALLIMILRMDKVMPASVVVTESLVVLCGGLWYMVVALLFFWIQPYRQAQRSLGNCIHETAKLLLIKAALYNGDTDLEEEYKKLLAQQVVVNERQDEVRELLFKDKALVKDTTRKGQVILITFTDAVDLYEQITATWYDYAMLKTRFSSTGILAEISTLIIEIANELDKAGLAIQSNIPYKKQFQLMPALNELKEKIDTAKIENGTNLVLKKILVNLRNLGERADAVSGYFIADLDLKKRPDKKRDYLKFVSHQEISFAIFRDNLHLNSSACRHALRMMITFLLGFMIVKLISYGHHSYWILLTILFILKPGYSITKQRNMQRIAGTIAGGAMGIVLITTIHDRNVLFGLIVFFMLGTYTFQRLNYVVMVICTTPYILILFSYLGLGFIDIVEERVLDTAIASVLAFFASYFLFPHWESTQLDAYMIKVLKANIGYLQKLKSLFSGNKSSLLEYKLVRKELYVSTANLSAAFNRMLSEPKSKQQNAPVINEFVVLNNVLSANIAGMFSADTSNVQRGVTKDILQPLVRSVALLEESLQLMDQSHHTVIDEQAAVAVLPAHGFSGNELKEEAGFIYKLAVDIKKVVQKIVR